MEREPIRMTAQLPARRKRIALAPSNEPVTEKEKAFSDVLASISRAQQERLILKKELDKHNTIKYCLLEAGAETFELTRVHVLGLFNSIKLWTGVLLKQVPFQLPHALVLTWIPARFNMHLSRPQIQPNSAPVEDPRIAELKNELLRLREEMKLLGTGVATTDVRATITAPPMPAPPPQTPKPAIIEGEKLRLGEVETARKRPAPLPFNAEMLITAKKQQKTPSKSAAVSPRAASKTLKARSPTMQEVLQKALEEKFKNVRVQYNDDLDTSFDNDFRPTKEEVSENSTRRPPIPPRPKLSRQGGSQTASKKKILGEQN